MLFRPAVAKRRSSPFGLDWYVASSGDAICFSRFLALICKIPADKTGSQNISAENLMQSHYGLCIERQPVEHYHPIFSSYG